MTDLEQFKRDRDEALISFADGDKDKMKSYCKKYGIEMPEDEEIYDAGIHKSICNMFLLDDSPITLEQYNRSYDWLAEHGYSPSVMGGEK